MPKKYTEDQMRAYVQQYRAGKRVAEICQENGVSKNTVYQWIKLFGGRVTKNGTEINGHRIVTLQQQNRHLRELLEVSKVCECGAAAPRAAKLKAAEKLEGRFSLHTICEYLDLSRSTYYNYKKTKNVVKVEDQKDELFMPIIKKLFFESGERFGSAPIRYRMKQQGFEISSRRVKRLMKEMNLIPMNQREVSNYYNPSSCGKRNKLKRKFTQDAPNKVWVSDFTYVYVDGKQYYLCVVMDIFSRKIVGYNLSDSCSAALVCKPAEEAFKERGEPRDLIFHSDLGTQYTAYEFFKLLKEMQVEQSFSRPGTPLDNAVAESFFATFKKEELYHREFRTYEELAKGIDDYICFYNNNRPHKKLGYLSPSEFEDEYYKKIAQV